MDDVWNGISRLPSPTSSRFQNFFSPILRSSRTATRFLPSPPSTPTDFISPATSSRFLLANKALSDQFDPLLKQYLIEGLVAFNKAIAELFEADNPVLHEKGYY
ncbi:hypothetical protein L1887_31763 [Cichorium endivia]|nr:hypothetical protein L1887_31763 [Cichorium endivia]